MKQDITSTPKPDRFPKPVRFIFPKPVRFIFPKPVRFITLFIFSLLLQPLFAQHISVESFTKLENDMDARVHHSKRDQNGEMSAIIKVVTTETGFAWDGGTLGIVDAVRKTGEYWVYIPRGAQRITISHDRLGVLRNYAYPVPIEAATVYEMRLTTARIETRIIEPVVETQWLVVISEPDSADVYIDNIHKGQTPVYVEMNTGTYSYRIEKPLYHPKAGRVELTIADRSTINETLDPNFGYLRITTQPESGAEITINGNRQSKTTPLATDKLVSDSYQVTVSKSFYHTESREVVVLDGQTTDVDINLRPNFGVVSVNTKPEAGAEVLVNGISTGKKTPCDLDRLPTGQHQITVRKEWYQPKTIAVNITDGLSDHFEIEMDPTFGTLNVQAEHDAEIFVNDDRKATTKWEGRLIAGWYTIEARKDKYHTDQKRVEIKLGETQNLSLHPKPKTGMLKIQTTPYDADITLNGKDFGKTPATIRDLLIGDYTIVLAKQGFATVTRSAKIVENETAEINETLPEGMTISIASEPVGAKIYIDNNPSGNAPLNILLGFGEHLIRAYIDGLSNEQTIIVRPDGPDIFKIYIAQPVNIRTNPTGARIAINEESQGTSPLNLNLMPGNYELKITKNGFAPRKTSINVKAKNKDLNYKLKSLGNMGFGYIFKSPGVTGGVDVFMQGKVDVCLSFMGIDPLEYSPPFLSYAGFGFSATLGYRFIYPVEFSVHGGYGNRMYDDKIGESDRDNNNAFILGARIPVFFTSRFGIYLKTDYWTRTEHDPLFVFSFGILFNQN